MADDGALRKCIICLAILMMLILLCTHSFKKTMVTYVYGMFAIGSVLLPDWEFFDRPVSQWTSPLTVQLMPPCHSPPPPSRFRFYPIRTMIYTIVYGYASYKWWMYIST